MFDSKENLEELDNTPSQLGELDQPPTYTNDAVFGETTEDGPNYRNVSCFNDSNLQWLTLSR